MVGRASDLSKPDSLANLVHCRTQQVRKSKSIAVCLLPRPKPINLTRVLLLQPCALAYHPRCTLPAGEHLRQHSGASKGKMLAALNALLQVKHRLLCYPAMLSLRLTASVAFTVAFTTCPSNAALLPDATAR